jgi:hypothetical protein
MTDAVREKVNALVRTAVMAAHPTVVMAFENLSFRPDPTKPAVHVAYQPGRSQRKDIGSRRTFRHMGVVIVTVMVAENSGTKTLKEIAATVFYALADKNFALGADGYLSLKYAENRNRGLVNGWYAYSVQVEYHQDVEAPAE